MFKKFTFQAYDKQWLLFWVPLQHCKFWNTYMVTGHCGGASFVELKFETRSSWLNCALRDDEAVFWVSIGQKQMVIDDTGSLEGIYAFMY